MVAMTKPQIEDKYFIEFVKWCANGPKTEKPGDWLFYVDYKFPSMDNFWEWIVKYKAKELQ